MNCEGLVMYAERAVASAHYAWSFVVVPVLCWTNWFVFRIVFHWILKLLEPWSYGFLMALAGTGVLLIVYLALQALWIGTLMGVSTDRIWALSDEKLEEEDCAADEEHAEKEARRKQEEEAEAERVSRMNDYDKQDYVYEHRGCNVPPCYHCTYATCGCLYLDGWFMARHDGLNYASPFAQDGVSSKKAARNTKYYVFTLGVVPVVTLGMTFLGIWSLEHEDADFLSRTDRADLLVFFGIFALYGLSAPLMLMIALCQICVFILTPKRGPADSLHEPML